MASPRRAVGPFVTLTRRGAPLLTAVLTAATVTAMAVPSTAVEPSSLQASAIQTASSGGTRTLTLTPVADVTARQQAPSTATGSATTLLSDSEETSGVASRATSYLRFTIPTLATGETITAAALSLHITNATTNGPAIWRTNPTWTESTLTWNTGRPARTGTAAIGNYGSVSTGRRSTPLTGITSSGTVSLELHADATDGMVLTSRESTTTTDRPQLVLTVTTG